MACGTLCCRCEELEETWGYEGPSPESKLTSGELEAEPLLGLTRDWKR